MSRSTILVASCAPRTINVGGTRHNPATEAMLAGRETDPDGIRAHCDRFMRHHLDLLEKAGAAGAQLAVIPEDCLRLGGLVGAHGRRAFCRGAVGEAEAIYREAVGATCRRYGMMVAGGTLVEREGKYFNRAILIDGEGRAIGEYDKTHLPRGEARYTTPGADLPVFETPLGTVGMLICWDIVFPEPYSVLALKGAEIILEPTFGHWHESDDVTARSRAMDWTVPLVVSMWGGCSCIIDAEGNFAARAGRGGDSLVLAPVELRPRRKWCFFNDTRAEKPAWRRPDLYGRLGDL